MLDFETMLDEVVSAKSNTPAPAGLEQRVLARLAQTADTRTGAAPQFATAARMVPQRSRTAAWFAMGAHAVAMLLLAAVVTKGVQMRAPQPRQVVELVPRPPLPVLVSPHTRAMGGGGGQHGPAPVSAGHLPKFAAEQLLPPKAPPLDKVRLAVEPTLVMQPDLKLADNRLPDLGAPNSTLKGFSLGNGSGTGIGSGNGAGVGPGSGGNTGGGVFRVGGAVLAPRAIFTVEPEFSEEARKAKFSGGVLVGLIVDEQGRPTNVHLLRDVGMGLGEKAMEAVRQYRFKPAMRDGKPVKVEVAIDVNFQIF